MKEVWKKIASKGYMAVTVLLVAVLGTVYFVFLKGDDETAGTMKDINSTTEKIVFPEEVDGPKKEEPDEVLLAEQETEAETVPEQESEISKQETMETQVIESVQEAGNETSLESEQPEQTSEKEVTATHVETPRVEETLDNQETVVTPEPEPTPEPVVEATPESTPEPTSEPSVESTPESTPEATPEPVPEATPESTPEPPKEDCVHHWLFESYFQEPTCSSGGLENQICARCGETRTVPGTPTGQHAYVVETEGDCSSAEIVRCENCNTREVREKDPEKHIDVEDGICYGCGEKVE